MKKCLVNVYVRGTEYGKVYGSVNVLPYGVEVKDKRDPDGLNLMKKLPITKKWRDSEYGKKAIAEIGEPTNWCSPNDLMDFHIEIGVETITHDDFAMMGVTVLQEAQRWYLNIFGLSGKHSVAMVKTYDGIDDVLNRLQKVITDENLNPSVMYDVVYRLISSENQDFIAKITAERGDKEDKRDAKKGIMRILHQLDSDLLRGILGWLMMTDNTETVAKLARVRAKVEEHGCDEEVYTLVDKLKEGEKVDYNYYPLFEYVLGEYAEGYVPRVFSAGDKAYLDANIEGFVDEALSDLKKDRREPYIGGYYIGYSGDSKDKYLTKYLRLDYQLEDIFDNYGYELVGELIDKAMQKKMCRYHSVSNAIKSKNDDNTPYTDLMLVVQVIDNDKEA